MGTVSYLTIDGEIVSETRSGIESDYVADSLGSTVALLDNAQTVTDTWTYWPYGEIQDRTGTNATPMQWVGTLGYRRDSALRSQIRARVAAMDLARWQTVDPLWPGEPPFSYCSDNPGSHTDPNGTQEWWLPICGGSQTFPVDPYAPVILSDGPCTGSDQSECDHTCRSFGESFGTSVTQGGSCSCYCYLTVKTCNAWQLTYCVKICRIIHQPVRGCTVTDGPLSPSMCDCGLKKK